MAVQPARHRQDAPPPQAGMRKQMEARGHGIAKVETLTGNIGYLDMRGVDYIQFAGPARMRLLTPYFAAFIPIGRAINPVTETNREGPGVIPDISVPADDALTMAHKLALEKLAAASADP